MEQQIAFEIPRTERFKDAAKKLGDFINEIDLPADTHNKLVKLVIKQVVVAEEDACKFGIDLGIKVGKEL